MECDICGAPGTVGPTGVVYCADHAPGTIILPQEWEALTPAQQARRERVNAAVANNPPDLGPNVTAAAVE